jgi:hypothetical protein
MSNIDLVTNKLLEIINQIQSQIVNHSPDAINLILLNVKMEGITHLCVGVIYLLACVCLYPFLPNNAKSIKDEDINIGNAIGVTVFYICFGFSLYYFLNIWNYVAIFNPKLYLVNQLMNKFY